MSLLLSLGSIPVAHAFSNSIGIQRAYYDLVTGHENPCVNVAVCTINNPLFQSVNPGDLLILFTACNPATSTISSVTDGQGDTWVLGKAATQATQNSSIFSLRVEGWYSLSAHPTSGGSIGNVVISFSGTVSTCNLWIASVNVAPTTLADSDGQTAINSGTSATAVLTSKAFNSPSNTYYVAFEGAIAKSASSVSCSGAFTPTAPLVAEFGSNFCNTPQQGNYVSNTGLTNAVSASGGADTYQSGFFSNTLQVSQTSYNTGTDHSSYAAVFLRFGPSVTNVNPYFVGCTFYEMQCWWYPLLFLGLYSSFYIGVATAFRVSTKAKIYMMFSGLSMAGLISIILGILTLALPLLMIAASVVYVLRMKGVI